MEKILKIEVHEENKMEGFIITTNKQVIKLLIDNCQCCCEDWGYFMSEEKFDDYIGANLLNITLTDEALETVDTPKIFEGGLMFVNVETDKGVLQFVAYNEHNGYYGHEAKVVSEQLNYSDVL